MKKMYLVRKRNGTLRLGIGGYAVKEGGTWIFEGGATVVRLEKECFPEVKWEDDEPTEVILLPNKR